MYHVFYPVTKGYVPHRQNRIRGTVLRKEAYENYAFDVGLCTGCWLYSSGKLVTSKLGMEWSQKPYVKSVLSEWLEAGRSFDGNKLFTTEYGYIGTISY